MVEVAGVPGLAGLEARQCLVARVEQVAGPPARYQTLIPEFNQVGVGVRGIRPKMARPAPRVRFASLFSKPKVEWLRRFTIQQLRH